MIEKYKKIAIKLLEDITHFEEKSDAFIFYNDNIVQDGCCVILKKDSKVLTMTEYIMRSQETR